MISKSGGRVYASTRGHLLRAGATGGDGHPPEKPLIEPGYGPITFSELRLARFSGNTKVCRKKREIGQLLPDRVV